MRVAIVHDSLDSFGGGERVLQSLLSLLPSAHVYTAFFDKRFIKEFFNELWPGRLFSSWVQNTPLTRYGSVFQCVSPWVWRSFNFKEYDVILSMTAYLGSNLVNPQKAVHIQYIHSPPKNLLGLEPPFPLQKLLPYAGIVVKYYKNALRSTPHVLVNSLHMQRVIDNLFGVKSKIIYPPVIIPPSLPKRKKPKHYLCVSRLDQAKSLELAITVCNQMGLPLKIVGWVSDPIYEKKLRAMAGPTIEFLGFRRDQEIDALYQEAIAFIFTSKNEDFGIAPVEAMAHGVPVIAYWGGGVKETVIPQKTGVFFYEHTASALASVLQKFDPRDFRPQDLYQRAKKFSQQKFAREMRAYINQAISNHVTYKT